MESISILITNDSGIHAGPASLIVKEAIQYAADIFIVYKDMENDAKSVLSILTMGVLPGSTIEIKASGTDEKEAIKSLEQVFKKEINKE